MYLPGKTVCGAGGTNYPDYITGDPIVRDGRRQCIARSLGAFLLSLDQCPDCFGKVVDLPPQ